MTNQWISTHERLPDEGQLVIAYDDKMHHCKFSRGDFYRHTEPSSNDRIINYYYTRITHWQPELEAPSQVNKISSSPMLSEVLPPSDQYPDNEADGIVFCGKCGARK